MAKTFYTYYFTVEAGYDHPRFHTSLQCRFAARLLGYDRLSKTTSSLDEDRCDACGGRLRDPVKKRVKPVI